MSLARIYSRAQVGINAPEVIVEVHLGTGLPAFHIVGLPEASVKESKDRVRSALENSQFGFPDQRITVNQVIYTENHLFLFFIVNQLIIKDKSHG